MDQLDKQNGRYGSIASKLCACCLLLLLMACGPQEKEDLPADDVSASGSPTTLSKQTAGEVSGTDIGTSEESLCPP